MTVQTLYLLDIKWNTSPALLGLVFFSTLVIYALHRLVSLQKVDESLGVERFKVIGAYKRHIQIYACCSVVGGAICFFYLNRATQIALVIPAILSLAYVLPFLGQKKLRLRDVHFIKIFLIAIVWAYVTVLLPLLELGEWTSSRGFYLMLERMFFIFLITLPFDIRDWEIDKSNGVLTLPAQIGVQNTLYLALLILLTWMAIIYFLFPTNIFLILSLSGISSTYLVWISPRQKHDYFFTALMDGTMLIQGGLLFLF